jgi:hypothetical protein
MEGINLPQLDIQGELGGKLGVQQGHGILQETWGESWWEEIVCGLRQEGGAWSHHQPGIALIKNSANVMHNVRVNTKIKLLPPC